MGRRQGSHPSRLERRPSLPLEGSTCRRSRGLDHRPVGEAGAGTAPRHFPRPFRRCGRRRRRRARALRHSLCLHRALAGCRQERCDARLECGTGAAARTGRCRHRRRGRRDRFLARRMRAPVDALRGRAAGAYPSCRARSGPHSRGRGRHERSAPIDCALPPRARKTLSARHRPAGGKEEPRRADRCVRE